MQLRNCGYFGLSFRSMKNMDKKFIKGTYQEMIQEIRKKDASSSEEANR